MTFWCGSVSGSRSADPDSDLYPDSDPDPAIFSIDLHDANKKLILKKFFNILLFEGKSTSFLDKKVNNKSQNSRNQGFSTIFA
jgi:hypothetical protein